MHRAHRIAAVAFPLLFACAGALLVLLPDEPAGTRIISGSLLDRDGRAFREGELVTLLARDGSSSEDGRAVHPVATALVDADGHFDLRCESVGDLARFATPGGSVTFELRAVEDDSFARHVFSRVLTASSGHVEVTASEPADPAPLVVRAESDPSEFPY